MKTHEKDCPLTIYSDNYNNYRLAGCIIGLGVARQQRTLAIHNPMRYAKILLRQALTTSPN